MFGYHAISSVWPLVSYLNSMVSFLPVSVSQIVDYCSLCEIVERIVFQALYAAARLAVGSADRLLAVFFPQCRDSTLPSLANPEIS